jgi:hypothetical protein
VNSRSNSPVFSSILRRIIQVKKIFVVLAAVIALVLVVSPVAVFAGPPNPPNYGVVDPVGIDPGLYGDEEKIIPAPNSAEGQIHIVTDYLLDNSNQDGGWVTFWCSSTVGFQYNIGAYDLEPLSVFAVNADGIELTFDPNGPIEIEGVHFSLVGLVELDLGNLYTDANGLGGVNGIQTLAPDVYELFVRVTDSDSNVVLESDPADPQDLIVY